MKKDKSTEVIPLNDYVGTYETQEDIKVKDKYLIVIKRQLFIHRSSPPIYFSLHLQDMYIERMYNTSSHRDH